jgi:hypothetical protein
MKKMVERTQRRRDEEKRKAVWPTTIIRQSLSGSTGAMETHPTCIMYVWIIGKLPSTLRHVRFR